MINLVFFWVIVFVFLFTVLHYILNKQQQNIIDTERAKLNKEFKTNSVEAYKIIQQFRSMAKEMEKELKEQEKQKVDEEVK